MDVFRLFILLDPKGRVLVFFWFFFEFKPFIISIFFSLLKNFFFLKPCKHLVSTASLGTEFCNVIGAHVGKNTSF